MASPCGCGAEADYEHETKGICHDCYKGLSAEERKLWIHRKLRGAARPA